MDNHNGYDWDNKMWKHVRYASFDYMTKYIFSKMNELCDFTDKTILELGCGLGRLSFLCLQNGAKSVTCVDSSQKALSVARELFNNDDRATLVEDDILNYHGDKHDIVFSSGVIEHFENEDRFRVVQKHLELANECAVIIHPSDSLYNRFLVSRKIFKKLYGFQMPFSVNEINNYIDRLPHGYYVHKRFYMFYCIPLLHNSGTANRFFHKLEEEYGGLLVTVINPA